MRNMENTYITYIFFFSGEKWHHRRKMLTPAFHFQILKKFFPTFCEHSQELVNNLEKELFKDKTDLFPIISKATLGLICGMTSLHL